jgi:hypothetical protein
VELGFARIAAYDQSSFRKVRQARARNRTREPMEPCRTSHASRLGAREGKSCKRVERAEVVRTSMADFADFWVRSLIRHLVHSVSCILDWNILCLRGQN